jgi:hypothetical protein
MGLSHGPFYLYKAAVEQGGVDPPHSIKVEGKPHMKNWADDLTEQSVLAYVLDYPAHEQVRVSNE